MATLVATLLLAVLMISFRPFPESGPSASGGDVVNQIGFAAIGGISVFCMAGLVDRRVLASLLSPWWIVVLAFFALSVVNAANPAAAARTAVFTIAGLLGILAILTLPRDADSFTRVLLLAGAAVVGLCYVGLLIYPDIARHTADSLEPEHAGFWRGVYTHKNIAGPVMACFSFAGLYAFRRGWRMAGVALFLASLLFMSNTGSKTTALLVPVTILVIMAPSLLGLRILVPLAVWGALGATALLTMGTVLFDPINALVQAISPGQTFTGRTALWEFLVEMIRARPLWGYGYESFWGTPFITLMDQPFDREWDIRGIVHGHNGYLDLAALMGLPALLAFVAALLIVPMLDFLRAPPLRENVLLADLFAMMLLFTALNALLESFFFRRADPVWLFCLMAAFGLRLVARFPVPRSVVGPRRLRSQPPGC